MKRYAAITLVAVMLAALLAGCAGTNYGYGYGYDGNVSTTDNGYVNGTNGNMTGSYYYDDANGYQGAANGTGNGTRSNSGVGNNNVTGNSGRPTPRTGSGTSQTTR